MGVLSKKPNQISKSKVISVHLDIIFTLDIIKQEAVYIRSFQVNQEVYMSILLVNVWFLSHFSQPLNQ